MMSSGASSALRSTGAVSIQARNRRVRAAARELTYGRTTVAPVTADGASCGWRGRGTAAGRLDVSMIPPWCVSVRRREDARGVVTAYRVEQRVVLDRVGEHHALVADRAGTLARAGQELEVAAAQVPQVHGRVEDGQRVVHRHGVRGGPQERVEPGRIGEQPAGGRLVEDRPDELLLVPDAGEVAVRERVPLTRVVERGRAVHVLPALREVAPAVAVERMGGRERVLDVEVDAAQGVHDLLEAGEVDHDDMVDAYPREGLHGLH